MIDQMVHPSLSHLETTRLHVGYVLKQYPRLSETFILNEILGVEGTGAKVSVFSLRPPTEGRFHPDLASVEADVHYLAAPDKAVFLDAIRALPDLCADRLVDVLAFVDLLPADRRARLVLDAIAVAREVRRSGVEHLHAHFLTVAAHTAHLVHLLTGVPYTVTAHAKDIYRHDVNWEIAARVGSRAAAVVTVCDANLSYLRGRLDGSGTRLVRIYNGLGPQAAPAPLAARTNGLVLGVGRMVEKKGFDVLLDAFAEVAATRRDARCVLVGDGDCRAALEAQARRLGIADRVTFTGAQPQQVVGDWLRRAHVMVAPCRVGEDGNQDALPTVLLESLGAGLPSVSTPVAGITEIIEHGIEGLIVPRDDVEATAAAIVDLFDDSERWRTMSDAGPRKLAARFDRSRTIAELVGVMDPIGATR
ncbi:MAG: glycosyltransferase family 4 protein [Acidimicrobiales bacterium]